MIFVFILIQVACNRIAEDISIRRFIASGNYSGAYWPTDDWRRCSPEEVGLNSDTLYQAYEYAAEEPHNTHGLIIVKDGYIVGEEYLKGHNQSSRFTSYSVAKSVLSALFGIAITEGIIPDIDAPAHTFLPRWQRNGVDPLKLQITIRHLLGMASGIEWNEDYSDPDNDIQRMVNSGNYLKYVLDLPLKHQPFTVWQYNTGNSIILSGILQNTAGQTALDYTRNRLFEPIGMADTSWESDATGMTVGGWGIVTTLRNYAKFALLYLNKGLWGNQQLIPQAWIEKTSLPINNYIWFYGLHWWLLKGFDDFSGSGLPDNIILAQGIHGQLLYVIPDSGIIVAKAGFDNDPLFQAWDHMHFLKIILSAIDSR